MAEHVDGEIEGWIRATSPRLVGALTLHTGDAGVAEEVAQEAFVRAWERWDDVSHMANPAGWVYRTAFNLAMSGGRRRAAERRAHRRLAHRSTTAEPNLSALATGVTDRLALRAVLDRLSDRQRAAVVLRFYGQLSVAETAEVMACAEGTVKALTSQGVATLRTQLGVDVGTRDTAGGAPPVTVGEAEVDHA